MKSVADLLSADPLFMGAVAAWPLAGERPAPQVCELAILDKNGAILFDTIIKPDHVSGAGLQTRLIPVEHVRTAPTIDTLWGNLCAITNRRDVVMFNQRLIRVLLKASAMPYNLPPLPGYAHSVQGLYLDHHATAFTATESPTLSYIALHCELEDNPLAISQNQDLPWRIHHAVNEAETCRRVLMYLAACAQANGEGQQGDPHDN